ncbi:TPA: PTS lactose/cellobiose transporter subunit IIA [Streptococcus pneumoniae]
MKSKEEINMLGFTIVAYAGDARSDLMDALAFARDGYFEQARELVESASDSIVSAHREQTNLLAEEASGDNFEVSFIMIHGQDTLMTTMLLYDQVKFFIDEYERIRKIEEHIGLQ